MREPALALRTSILNGSSFLQRIRENLQSVWKLPWAPLPAASVPIHLLDERRSYTTPAGQLGSTLLHAVVGAALIWLAMRPPISGPLRPAGTPTHEPIPIPRWLLNAEAGNLGKTGDSGGHNPLPATAGELAPPARIALIAPHVPDSRPHPLDVPVTIADPDAPDLVRTITDPGLPWMSDKNNSEGHGEHGIGNGDHHGMGDGPGDGSGIGNENGPYTGVSSQVICRVCPDPLYSEEARKTKLQGSVLLAVLVGADGRAHDVRILRGIGMGLDENAIQAVRTWQFIPARDAQHQPVASWIKVETMFRLF